jgi:hypothetical protein
MKMQATEYELKYCERCGALRLRRCPSPETYCGPCRQILNNYSFPGASERRSLLRKSRTESEPPLKLEGMAQAPIPFGRLQ